MKGHIADDGTVFQDLDACKQHDKVVAQMAKLEAEVNRYLELTTVEGTAKKTVTQRRKVIMGWLEHDVRQHGERYGMDFSEAAAVSGVEE